MLRGMKVTFVIMDEIEYPREDMIKIQKEMERRMDEEVRKEIMKGTPPPEYQLSFNEKSMRDALSKVNRLPNRWPPCESYTDIINPVVAYKPIYNLGA